MKITSSILSIPPYLSTTWKNISSLHVREERGVFVLIAALQNGTTVEVPGLAQSSINEIFEAHARSAEEPSHPLEPFSFSLPLKGDGPALLGPAMQHNAEQADFPPLPPEILGKITAIARAFGIDDAAIKAEPHCNCMYCQIAKALQSREEEGEEVSEEDLKFRNWEIAQEEEHLYKVTNPLDPNEEYKVFLGTPLGCTCGSKNCEHIRAVLSS